MKCELLLWLGLVFFNTSHLQKLGFLYAISLFLALKMHHHIWFQVLNLIKNLTICIFVVYGVEQKGILRL